jgi:hypothetical protein
VSRLDPNCMQFSPRRLVSGIRFPGGSYAFHSVEGTTSLGWLGPRYGPTRDGHAGRSVSGRERFAQTKWLQSSRRSDEVAESGWPLLMASNPLVKGIQIAASRVSPLSLMKYLAAFSCLGLLAGVASLPAQAPSTGLTVEYVAAHRELWPKQIITKAPVQVALRLNGGPATPVLVPAGELMKVVGVAGVMIQLEYQGAAVTMPAVQTDLLAGAAANQSRLFRGAQPAPAAASATNAPNAAAPAAPTAPSGPVENPLIPLVRDALIAFRSDSVVAQPSTALDGKRFIALYFATRNSEASEAFTPVLRRFYSDHRRDSAKFEIILISLDHSAQDMAYHIRNAEMPWLAVDFARQDLIGRLRQQFGGSDVPNLVVIDENGRVVVTAYDGKTYLGGNKAMEDFGRLLDRS